MLRLCVPILLKRCNCDLRCCVYMCHALPFMGLNCCGFDDRVSSDSRVGYFNTQSCLV